MAKGRKTGGRDFAPGEAPNPRGRPKVAKEFKQRCREWAESNGWNELLAIAENSESPDHWRAIEMIHHYAYGKPTQPIAGDEGGAPIGVVILPAVKPHGDG